MTESHSTVYVIDDDASVRNALRSLIRSVGLEAEIFGTPREFLQGAAAGCTQLPGP